MNNIPQGYDENGVRNGNGSWRDNFLQPDEVAIEDGGELDIIECLRCGKVIDRKDAVILNNGYICQVCAEELELN